MAPFTLKTNLTEEPDYSALLSTLKRTGARSFRQVLSLGAQSPGAILAHLDRPPGQIRALIKAWDEIGKGLPQPTLSASERQVLGRAPLPAQRGWVRLLAEGLTTTPAVEAAVGVKGSVLSAIVERDVQARALNRNAELAKDGAMDLRAITGAYAFFQLATALDWVRERIPKVSEAEANTLLRDFAPVLVLIGQILDDQEAARAAASSAREKVQAAAAEAEKVAREAETRAALRTGQDVSDEDLQTLLEEEEAPKGRRSRR